SVHEQIKEGAETEDDGNDEPASAGEKGNRLRIAVGHRVIAAIEPDAETFEDEFGRGFVCVGGGPEEQGGQCGAEGKCIDRRNAYGYGQGDTELSIKDAR